MAFPPYAGQGASLPKGVSFEGQWVIEGEIFLFRANPPKSQGEFAGLTRPDGIVCDGFDADSLAEMLQVSVAELLALNQRGLLFVEYRDRPLKAGLVRSREFDFRTPNGGVRIPMAASAVWGRA